MVSLIMEAKYSMLPHSTRKEDNNGALILANSPIPHMTPCSKHIGVKYHWFYFWIDGVTAVVKPIKSVLQRANIFTKPLGKFDFASKRKMLLERWCSLWGLEQ
eukprot:12347585-Ditylum_brightwellii.AAC.1